jgi:hypothetical protein
MRPTPEELGLRRAPKLAALVRAVIASARATFEPDRDARRVAKQLWADDPTTQLLVRASSAPADTTTAGWAAPLANFRVQDVLQNLGPASVGSQLLRQGLSLTFDRAHEIRVPGITVSAAFAGFVGEGRPIPVRQLPVSAGAILQPRKFATIVTLTREMIESSNAESLVRAVLVDAVAASLDAALFSTTPGDATRPAGLLNTATSVGAATGGGTAAMMTDLSVLAGDVAPYGGMDFVYITDPASAVRLAFAMGPQFRWSILASSGVAAKTLICLAPLALCSATDPAPRLESARDVAVHMEDTSPQDLTGGSPSPAVPIKSLYQVDTISIRLTMFVSWAMRAAGACAYVPAVSW